MVAGPPPRRRAGAEYADGIYLGRVLRADGAGPVVRVDRLAGSHEHGPCVTLVRDLVVGDLVALAPIEGDRNRLVVLGRLDGDPTEIGYATDVELADAVDAIDLELDALNAGLLGVIDDLDLGAWTNITGSVTWVNLNAGTSPTISVRARRQGRTAQVRGYVVAGGTGMALSAGRLAVRLPTAHGTLGDLRALEPSVGAAHYTNASTWSCSGTVVAADIGALAQQVDFFHPHITASGGSVTNAGPSASWFGNAGDWFGFAVTIETITDEP